jgi:UDP-2-acetamido-3-amino-2,3-dideoxy-glucuronate N-acetyltransferase
MNKIISHSNHGGFNNTGKKHTLKNVGKTTVVINYTRMSNGLIIKNQQIKPGETITIYYQTGTFYSASQSQLQTISVIDLPEVHTTTTTTMLINPSENQELLDIEDEGYNFIVEDPEPMDVPTKILVATIIWKRFDLFRKLVHHYHNLGLDVLAIGSEGDISKKICEDLNCAYIEHPNDPLGSKMNRRLDYFLEKDEYTHILLVGSDDFLDEITINKIYENIPEYDVISWSDLYYIDDVTGEVLYSEGYKNSNTRRGEPIAPGRCISKKVIRELRGQLWDQHITKSPDFHSWMKLRKFSKQIIFSCKEIGGIILDVKTPTNKNSFEKVKKLPTTFEVSHEEKEKIYNLYKNPNITYTVGSTSKVSEFSNIARSVQIGEFCFIDRDVEIGEGTIIKNFVELRPNTKIGKNCYIDSRVSTSGECEIGDNVTLRYDTIIARGCKIGDGSYLAPRVMTNNLDSGKNSIGGAHVGENCFIGTNAVLQHGITIGEGSVVGSMSFVTKDIPMNEIWFGSPSVFHKKIEKNVE